MGQTSDFLIEWARQALMKEALRRESIIREFLQSGAFLNELSSIQNYNPSSWRIE